MSELRQQSVRIAKEMVALKPVYLDAETTGLNELDVIVEMSILDWDGSMLVDTLVKPNRPIPAQSSAVHGITDAKVAWSPGWKEVWPQVVSALEGRVVAIYNAAFDIRMMRQSCGLNGITWQEPFADDFCIMELFARYFGEWDARRQSYAFKNLAFAGKYFNLPEPNSHRGKDDAMLAKLVLEKMAEG